MVEAMANTIVNVLPASMAPHMHWFMALFSVPLMMILGTDPTPSEPRKLWKLGRSKAL